MKINVQLDKIDLQIDIDSKIDKDIPLNKKYVQLIDRQKSFAAKRRKNLSHNFPQEKKKC